MVLSKTWGWCGCCKHIPLCIVTFLSAIGTPNVLSPLLPPHPASALLHAASYRATSDDDDDDVVYFYNA